MADQPAAPPPPPAPAPSPAPVPAAAPGEVEQNKDARTMAMIAHILGIFTGFLGPLIIWLIKKAESPFIEDQAKEALNFQITMFIAFLVAGASMILIVGFLLVPALSVVNIILCIMAGMAANNGMKHRYPFAIRLIK